MWQLLAGMFVACGIVSVVVTEIIRSVIDRRRVRREGIGGTQDIAICGCVVLAVCNLGAIICLILWLATW